LFHQPEVTSQGKEEIIGFARPGIQAIVADVGGFDNPGYTCHSFGTGTGTQSGGNFDESMRDLYNTCRLNTWYHYPGLRFRGFRHYGSCQDTHIPVLQPAGKTGTCSLSFRVDAVFCNNGRDLSTMQVQIACSYMSDNVKTSDSKTVSGDSKVYPQARDSGVTTSVYQEKLTCPRCGKSTLHAEFPDHYEAWIKCLSCGFFMGMSNDEWHSMENSPNIDEKIKRMAKKLKILP